MKYNEKTHLIISYLYQLRTLSYNQIDKYILEPFNLSTSYKEKIMKSLVKDKFIEKIGFYKEDAYFYVLKLGIQYLREYGLINLGNNEIIFLDSFVFPSKIKLKDTLISHQLSLNTFILDFKSQNPELSFEYFDELFLPKKFSIMSPDGILKFHNRYFFVEMDMGSEQSTSLRKKWEHYRDFLVSNEYYELNEPIEVLFILGGGTTSDSIRKFNIFEYFSEFLYNMISPTFNAIIDTHDQLLNYLREKYIKPTNKDLYVLKDQGFKITRNSFHNATVLDYVYEHFVFVPNENGIQISDGFLMGFAYDHFNSSMYTYKKIRNYPSISSVHKIKKNFELNYLIMVDSVQQAIMITKYTHVYGIFFTTMDRLNTNSFYKSFFTIDENLSVYHFAEDNFKVKIQEKSPIH